MVANVKIKMELPEFTEDRDQLIRIMRSGAAIAAGGELYLGIVALRKGEVRYEANAKGDGTFGWKGVREAATKYEIPAGVMSKITKVVSAYMPDVVTADGGDVKGQVLAFTAEHGTVSKAYDRLRETEAMVASDEAAAAGVVAEAAQTSVQVTWSLTSALDTVIRKAVKEGFTLEDVQEAIEHTMVAHYGAAATAAVLVDAS